MRGKLLQLLMRTSNTFVSGQEISENLGISRTAVWKHIEELRKNGYELEAVPRKGYRLTHTPNHATADEIEAILSTENIGKNIIYKKEVTSTQALAHDMARNDASEGTLVVADYQQKGKGRLGREWHSPPGTGLWFSLILRPDIPPQKAPQLTLLTAVAVTEGINKAAGIEAQIKWPNDILIDGKKTAGILTEMQSEPDRVQAVIVGIGININQQPEHFPELLLSKATSLSIAKENKIFSRAKVIAAILERYEDWYYQYLIDGFEQVRKRWEELAVTIGKEITATTVTKTVEGLAQGITEDGVLLLKKKDGQIEHIYSADIH
ncbi:biotin--[acetyl-CoA-carboxylase] ligase [Alteribacillus bidgolensis]|uniref:Bifunctional ligase/repressor BirA n=1 Tax=Alteribacillus bidgolensis TaxID=930129 RepID=A0A1G8C958_9BACI|nr:biotin--[acetyl-CoA-carboxylase] ligase [Alteribacillus bidgolensis]SDH41829.1 BirA family transcriptional regulator, biotin operon repressor / biotin-[acetyl-CoA-carboxylase] ligase [Alteribacillus bidgolensis]